MTRVRERLMTVGELSRRTGVSVKNLRQYTDWDLIYSVGRSAGGYRLYDADALWCVGMITTLRGLGLTVAEIRELAGAEPQCEQRQFGPPLARRLRASRARIQARIAELAATLERIDAFEAGHRAELAGHGAPGWTGDPRARRNCA